MDSAPSPHYILGRRVLSSLRLQLLHDHSVLSTPLRLDLVVRSQWGQVSWRTESLVRGSYLRARARSHSSDAEASTMQLASGCDRFRGNVLGRRSSRRTF